MWTKVVKVRRKEKRRNHRRKDHGTLMWQMRQRGRLVRRWKARLHDAGISSESDEVDFIGWLRAGNSVGSASAAAATGPARVALRSLEASGVIIPEAARAGLERDLSNSEAGDTVEQSTSRRYAWMILHGGGRERRREEWALPV